MTLNSFCGRVAFLNQQFYYPEEIFWIFTLFKKYLDLASRALLYSRVQTNFANIIRFIGHRSAFQVSKKTLMSIHIAEWIMGFLE